MMSPLESKILDMNSEALGVSVDELMDNAGAALFNVISERFDGKRILIVCGAGNNGGDGFACGKRFGKGADVALLFPPDKIKTGTAARHFNSLDIEPGMFSDIDLKKYDVIVDCVLGTGARSPLGDVYIDYVDRVRKFGGDVVAADVPTGFGTDCSFVPDITVTFHDVKGGMTKENCGDIVIADIGIPENASRLVGPGDMLRYPIPKTNSHKGQNGRLLIIGGGPYIGAPAMAGMAAFRIGADLVHIATPKPSFVPIASMTPNFIMHQTSDDVLVENDVPDLIKLSKKVDAVLVGPGLGTAEETIRAVRRFVTECDRPIVVDADGITAISSMPVISGNVIITPHHREFAAFTGNGPDDTASVQKVSTERNVTVLLKGETDVIAQNERVRFNETGTPAMTVGGTGDVLAGMVSGLLSKGMSTFDSACLGAYICGIAGEYAFFEHSYGMVATDVIDEIADVLMDYLDV